MEGKRMKEAVCIRNHVVAIFFLLVFGFLFMFFTQVHPLVIYDGDDWRYIAYTRQALPSWNEWNPSRVFAECFQPLMGYFAAYVLTPFLGDYLHAQTMAVALLLGLMATAYLWLFYRVMLGAGGGQFRALSMTVFFLLFHFLILKTQRAGNPYLFWSANVTCIYNYLMPMLLNASLVLLMMREGRLTEVFHRCSAIQAGFLSFWLYFAIFSGVFHSSIFIVFLGWYSLFDLRKAAGDVRGWGAAHRAELIVFALWLFSLVIETQGGRARAIGRPFFQLPWMETLQSATALWHQLNTGVAAFGVIIAILAAVEIHRNCHDEDERKTLAFLGLNVLSMVVVFVYLFLVCTKASPSYFERSDVAGCGLFYLLLLTCLAMNHFARRHSSLVRALPILIFVILIASLNPNRGFYPSTMGHVPEKTCDAISHDILAQLLAAEQAGEERVTLHVPVGNAETNWPHDRFLKDVLNNTLTRHGVLTYPLEIEIQPDPEMNRKYHLTDEGAAR